MSDPDNKRRGSGLKINNQNSVIEPPKQPQTEVFEKKADAAFNKMQEYKKRTWELSGQFRQMMQDRTLPENKSPISKGIEMEVLTKLIDVASEMDADELQPNGFGSNALSFMIMKMLLLQRDTINVMAFKIDQMDKKLNPPK